MAADAKVKEVPKEAAKATEKEAAVQEAAKATEKEAAEKEALPAVTVKEAVVT